MKIQRILPLSAILVGFAALPSLAGSSYVENSFNLKNTYNGYSKTDVDVNQLYLGTRSAGSDATKDEYSITKTDYNEKGDVAGSWRETNFSEVDVADISVSSWSEESGAFINSTKVAVDESYQFSGFDKTHRVTSGFDF
ncbi:hypothetical protein C1752_04110 [Acaryochloris thomasi RCC1774]|uniref:Uncharacterized protein n=1 Tax=Acaryochloris thomasi RCC1774 TaxID=1764569 RepID=A0A2W1JMM2_9CYAN|nr:hypothetical protein [Acaryochloris thomasi]PZD72132.1 hypothetical protein C1752_04110 [Acaryochloris thomasi RCC1774]